MLGVAYVVTLVAASLLALRRTALAGGLALGATLAIPLAPFLVVLGIVAHSE